METLLERKFVRLVNHIFAHRDDRGGVGADFASDFNSLIHSLLSRDNSRDESSLGCFLSSHRDSSQDHLHGSGFANSSRESLRASHSWDGSDGDFRLSELGILSSNQDIAEHSELTSSSKSIAIHSSDQGFLEFHQGSPLAKSSLHVGSGEHSLVHFLNVSSGSEGLLRASEDHASNFGVLIESEQNLVKLVQKASTESIQSLGSVELNESDSSLLFDEEMLIVGRRREKADGERLVGLGRSKQDIHIYYRDMKATQ